MKANAATIAAGTAVNGKRSVLARRLRHLELFGICAMVFSLPAMESPKAVALAILIMSTIIRRVMEGGITLRKPEPFEWGLLSLWFASLLSTAVNWPLTTGISGLENTTTCLAVGWLAYINQYKGHEQRMILWALMSGLMLALTWSWIDLLAGRNVHLEFHSIPNLNRSVIYHVIAMFVMLAVVMDDLSGFTRPLKIAAGVSLLICLPSLFVMGSRGGVLGFLAGLIVLFVATPKSRKMGYILAAGLISCAIMLALLVHYTDQPVINKRIDKFVHYYKGLRKGGDLHSMIIGSDRVRFEYLKVAWAQITQGGRFFIGTGPATYGDIDIDTLHFEVPLKVINKEKKKPSHAHNAYLNKWVEEGLIGLLVYLGFLIFMVRSLILNRPKRGRGHWAWIACLGTVSTTVVSGLFNNVITNEMGWLAMMVMGVYMRAASSRCRAFPQPAPLRGSRKN